MNRARAVRALAVPTGSRNPRSRPCPKCDAQRGRLCRRRVAGRVGGEDIGGGYWVDMKGVHDERKAKKNPTVDGQDTTAG